MMKATISSKGQIAIPKAIRDRLHLKAGMQLALEVEGDRVVMKRVIVGLPHWSTMRGMLRGDCEVCFDLAEERASELSREDGRFEGS